MNIAERVINIADKLFAALLIIGFVYRLFDKGFIFVSALLFVSSILFVALFHKEYRRKPVGGKFIDIVITVICILDIIEGKAIDFLQIIALTFVITDQFYFLYFDSIEVKQKIKEIKNKESQSNFFTKLKKCKE